MNRLECARLEHLDHQKKYAAIQGTIHDLKMELTQEASILYKLSLHLTHIEEIYRQAAHHFCRLRKQPEESLTDTDIAELDKWIGRAKDETGLRHIIVALESLTKFNPQDIKKNVYALVQKIIIEGPYRR